jgi:hypothetical protein
VLVLGYKPRANCADEDANDKQDYFHYDRFFFVVKCSGASTLLNTKGYTSRPSNIEHIEAKSIPERRVHWIETGEGSSVSGNCLPPNSA